MHLGVVKVGLLWLAKPVVFCQCIIFTTTKNLTLDNFVQLWQPLLLSYLNLSWVAEQITSKPIRISERCLLSLVTNQFIFYTFDVLYNRLESPQPDSWQVGIPIVCSLFVALNFTVLSILLLHSLR